jgi:hypothetical protein
MLYFLEVVGFFAYTALNGWEHALLVIFVIIVFNFILSIFRK